MGNCGLMYFPEHLLVVQLHGGFEITQPQNVLSHNPVLSEKLYHNGNKDKISLNFNHQ